MNVDRGLPRPRDVAVADSSLPVGPLHLVASDRLAATGAAERLRQAWPAIAATDGPGTTVRLAVDQVTAPPLALGTDESYALAVGVDGVDLQAATAVGARRGVETLLQIADHGRLPFVAVADAPHLRWRGLMVDICRHWIGLDTLLATVDAMAAAKLNVLHLHLSDDHAFRLESRVHPRLHTVGSDGRWLSHADVARLVDHAHRAGIRVVPELDVPGHVTSWLVAYPELAATPGPFALRTTPGIATDALHPERPEVREFVAALLAEVAGLFPDQHLHVGGDEVHEAAWPGLNVAAVQPEFTRWVTDEVRSLGRTPVVWDEAWHPGLAPDVVTQTWRGHALLRRAAAEPRPTLFSTPYYLDLSFDVSHHRVHPLIDADGWTAARRRLHEDPALGPLGRVVAAVEAQWPTPPDTPDHTDPTMVLGGEACLWSELVPERLLPLRLWPAAAVVADLLWAPPPATGPAPAPDLARFTRFLAATTTTDVDAVRHRHWLAVAAGDPDLADALATLATCCEPVKWYARHLDQMDPDAPTTFDRFVDGLAPTATARGLAPEPDRWRAAADVVLGAPGSWSARADLVPIAERVVAWCDHLADPDHVDPPSPAPVGQVLVVPTLAPLTPR